MALFKISKGTSRNLPSTLTEGYCWYTYDDSKFYIDYKDDEDNLVRKAINAEDAATLCGMSLEELLQSISWNDLLDRPVDVSYSNTLTWNGDIAGREVAYDMYYKIADATPSISELNNGYRMTLSLGDVYSTYQDNCVTQDTGNGLVTLSGDTGIPFAVIADDTQTDVPSGTYFLNTNAVVDEGYNLASLTIYGYNGFPKETIREDYLPNTIARKSDIAQSDWSETYDDSAAYIRNKPFGDFYKIKRTGNETVTVAGKYTTFTLVSNDVLEYEELSGVALYSGPSGSFPTLTRFSDHAYGTYSGILVVTQDGTTCSQVSNNPFPKAGVYLGSSTEYAVLQFKKIPEKYIPSKYETTDSVQVKIDTATENLASKEYVTESMTVTKIDTELTAAEIMALPDGMYYFTDNGRFSIYLYDSWAQDESAYVTSVTIRGLCKFDEYEIHSYDNGSSYYKDDPRVYDGVECVCSAVEGAYPMHNSYGGMYQLDTRQTINVRLRQYSDGSIEYENNNNYIEYLRTFGWGISSMLTQCTIHTNNSSQDFELYEVEKLVGDDEYLYGIKYVGYKDNYRYDVVCELNGITVNKTEIVTKDYVDSANDWEVLMDVTVTEECVEVIGATLTSAQKEKIANGDFVCYAECPSPTTTASAGWICGGVWANNRNSFALSCFGQPSGIVPASTDTHTSKIYSNLKNAAGDIRVRDMLYTTSDTPHQVTDFMDASEFMTYYLVQPMTIRFKTNGKFAAGTRLVCKVR